MKLFECEAKAVFSKRGIPTPRGGLATSPVQAREVAAQINAPVAVKAQVLVAGRTAPLGKRMGHAGAIIMGGAGTAQSKIEAFGEAGIGVAEKPSDVARLLAERLGKEKHI